MIHYSTPSEIAASIQRGAGKGEARRPGWTRAQGTCLVAVRNSQRKGGEPHIWGENLPKLPGGEREVAKASPERHRSAIAAKSIQELGIGKNLVNAATRATALEGLQKTLYLCFLPDTENRLLGKAAF